MKEMESERESVGMMFHSSQDVWLWLRVESPGKRIKTPSSHVSCLMSHVSCLMSHVSCPLILVEREGERGMHWTKGDVCLWTSKHVGRKPLSQPASQPLSDHNTDKEVHILGLPPTHHTPHTTHHTPKVRPSRGSKSHQLRGGGGQRHR